MQLEKIFFKKNVLITGHTGFKGSWLTAWLKQLGANIMGISKDIPTKPSHFYVSKIKNGIKDWLLTWIDNGWKTSENKEVKYVDLWKNINTKYLSHQNRHLGLDWVSMVHIIKVSILNIKMI